MSARRFKGPRSSGSSWQNLFITVLLIVVVVESFILARTYLKKPLSHRKPPAQEIIRLPIPRPKPIVKPEPPPAALEHRAEPVPGNVSQGKIAVIIDDSGYNARDCDHLRAIPQPVTISILPELEFSRTVANCAHDLDKGIMLHLPLEPHQNDEKYPENYIIKTSMSARTVVNLFNRALATVPFTEGINNHMGSKATENSRLMSIIFTELNNNNLFFVDSKVTGKSVCKKLANTKGVPFAERDVFLDNKSDRAYITGQFREAAQKARQRGHVIAIGHARTLSWEVIRDEIDKLSQEGFEFVTVKELIESGAVSSR